MASVGRQDLNQQQINNNDNIEYSKLNIMGTYEKEILNTSILSMTNHKPEWKVLFQSKIFISNSNTHVFNVLITRDLRILTYFGLVMTYGDINLGQHCFR